MSTFYNTVHATGPELATYERAAKFQDRLVLAFFRARPRESFSPSQVWGCIETGAPLTSIRRAITNLTAAGTLTKTDKQIRGPYGKPEHCWRYAPPELQLGLFR